MVGEVTGRKIAGKGGGAGVKNDCGAMEMN
jgi:hypothetical protein